MRAHLASTLIAFISHHQLHQVFKTTSATMQISLITALAILGYLSPAFASPAGGELRVRSASDISAQEYAAMPDMEFVGPLTPGGPNVTIVGTAKAIYESILEQNPSYNPWDFPEYAERMAAQGLTDSSSVEKRQESHINCDFGTMVGEFSTQCNEGLNYLDRIAGYCGAPPGHAGCSRVSCSHNCAMVLCNDVSFVFALHYPTDMLMYFRTPSRSMCPAATLPATSARSTAVAEGSSSRCPATSSGAPGARSSELATDLTGTPF